MRALLMRQKEAGVLLADVDTRELAEQLVIHVCALWVDWSDRGYELDRLRRSICAVLCRTSRKQARSQASRESACAFTQVTG